MASIDVLTIFILMSANRLRNNPKRKLEDAFKKDLTPKNSKQVTKISPAYASFRSGLTLRSDVSAKTRVVRPSTSKHSSDSQNYFQSRLDIKNSYSSTKKFKREESLSRRTLTSNQYEYQPRSKSKSPAKQPDEIVRQEVDVAYPARVNMNRDIQLSHNDHPDLPKVLNSISNFERAKHSLKPNGLIKAYAASTNQGPVRDYNEDRVAIIFNIPRP